MIVEDDTVTETAPAEVAVPQLETRFSIAQDAITRGKNHADEALRQFLQTAGRHLAGFRIDSADESPLDARVLSELAAMKPCRDYFLELVHLSCEGPGAQHAHESFRSFLGQSIALKQPPRDIIHFNHLWCDHYRFFVRELFLCTIALLIGRGKFDEVADYLQSPYTYPSQSGNVDCNFLSFDAYIKSLDEFRCRRLRMQCESIAADVLRERADSDYVSFDDIMQADFLLCVYGLLHHPGTLSRWCPRTLIHAERYEQNGFDIFSGARSSRNFAAVATILNVADANDLWTRFERCRQECRLDQWKIGGRPIPFAPYMGGENLPG